MSLLSLPQPYVLFVGDPSDRPYAKTALGLSDWASDKCVGETGTVEAPSLTGLDRLSPAEAKSRGAKALVIGVATPGGFIAESWLPRLLEAIDAGLSIVAGMHVRLGTVTELRDAAARKGVSLIDVRVPPEKIAVGNGLERTGRRLLTVGTDCALGKKYTAIAISRAFQRRGIAADFRATGQTGIMIAGDGIPIDAVIGDFLSGAAEAVSPAAAADHWDVIEGQGSLFHPAYAAVSLGLLHGAQPDVLVLCHAPGRTHILGHPSYPVPSLGEAIDLNLRLARLTSKNVRFGGVSLNTGGMTNEAADAALADAARETGLPCADPVRGGDAFERLVAACLA